MDPVRVPVYVDELLLLVFCSLLVLFFGTRGQNVATFVGVVGALLHSPPVVALAVFLAWVSNRERPNGAA